MRPLSTIVLATLVAVLALIVAAQYAARAEDKPYITLEVWNDIIDQTNFEVDNGCSGTLIDLEKRLVLTAHHCVTQGISSKEEEYEDEDGNLQKRKARKFEALQVTQYSYDGFKRVKSVSYDADIVAYSDDFDLAVVKISSDIPNKMSSQVAKKNPVRGEPVKIVGNPGLEYGSVVDSNVSSVSRRVETDRKRDAIQLPGVYFGNSGGAIYNMDGEIVGVAHAKRRGTDVIGFAIPASSINKFLVDNCKQLERCPAEPPAE
jgi:S1-C subfamily serine protease